MATHSQGQETRVEAGNLIVVVGDEVFLDVNTPRSDYMLQGSPVSSLSSIIS